MRIYDIITKKKQGIELTKEEIDYTISAYMSAEVADYQMSALLMAICLKGMGDTEAYHLTRAMLESGDTVDLSRFSTLSVDKHSTGGVGDKTTLIVAPIVATLGCKMAKMSGRGLGFTGGTVDKLEAITGYKATLDSNAFLEQVEAIGISVVGQSANLAPADKKLYALRDVTATIDSIPLIASSIMSKKLASGAHNIVLDVKCGSGAFMKTRESAAELARAMIKIGTGFKRNVRALVTNMDVPLGIAVGNRTEVWEAIQVLSGRGDLRLTELCIELASNIASLALNLDTGSAKARVLDAISTGKALCKMKEWIACQGGDISYIESPKKLLMAKHQKPYIAKADGYIEKILADSVGTASMMLGAGRVKLNDKIDYNAGIIFNKSYGDFVKKGECIATLYSDNDAFKNCIDILDNAIVISKTEPPKQELIFEIL
ncbi:MAG: thymidine phosphorylase [Ruminococcaceae bacterium]|nr:thymidine phosphorylase [Oscillospiraceae bacterium]